LIGDSVRLRLVSFNQDKDTKGHILDLPNNLLTMKLSISIVIAVLTHILVLPSGVSADGVRGLRSEESEETAVRTLKVGGGEKSAKGDKGGKGEEAPEVEEPEVDKDTSLEEELEPEHPPAVDCPEVAPQGCLTVEGVNGIIQAFEGAVVAISNVRSRISKKQGSRLCRSFCSCCLLLFDRSSLEARNFCECITNTLFFSQSRLYLCTGILVSRRPCQ
jgi:hypothetical protein